MPCPLDRTRAHIAACHNASATLAAQRGSRCGVWTQGYVYVLDSEGAAREGWPVQMGDVQGQVAVADIDSDGRMCAPGCPAGALVMPALCRHARMLHAPAASNPWSLRYSV